MLGANDKEGCRQKIPYLYHYRQTLFMVSRGNLDSH